MKRRTKGQAEVGDKVTYWDVANQDGKVWTVTAVRTQSFGGAFMWVTDFELTDADGNVKHSDLRQHGWSTVA